MAQICFCLVKRIGWDEGVMLVMFSGSLIKTGLVVLYFSSLEGITITKLFVMGVHCGWRLQTLI